MKVKAANTPRQNMLALNRVSQIEVRNAYQRKRLNIDGRQIWELEQAMWKAAHILRDSKAWDPGRLWYTRARNVVREPVYQYEAPYALPGGGYSESRSDLAQGLCYDFRAMVLAVLSQRTRWEQNVDEFSLWLSHYVRGNRLETASNWTAGRGLKQRWDKVAALERCYKLNPLFAKGVPVGLGLKVAAFYYNVRPRMGWFPWSTLWCHDTHMARWTRSVPGLADKLGLSPKVSGGASVREHALHHIAAHRTCERLGWADFGPCDLQALIWVAVRDRGLCPNFLVGGAA